MRKIRRIFMLISVVLLLSSCNINAKSPSLILYQKYVKAIENVNSLDSFSRDENVHIDLSSLGEQLDFELSSSLKYQNQNNSDLWELSFNINNTNDILKLYYSDENIYIDSNANKFKIYAPSIINDLSNVSVVSKMQKSDLISATSMQQDGFEQITFIFNGDDTSIYLNKLTDIGIKNLDVLEITPSDVTMIANIDDNGYLIDQKIIFDTKISLTYDGKEYDSQITYDATINNYDFNNTYTDTLNGTDIYKNINAEELKDYLYGLLIE